MLRIQILLLSLFFSFSIFALVPGEYSSNCFPHGEGLKDSFQSSVLVSEERFEGKFILFEGPGCKKSVLTVDFTAEMNFPEEKEFGPLDLRVGKAFMVVMDEKLRQEFMMRSLCGDLQLELYVPFEIQGLQKCGPFPVPASGTLVYDYFKKEGHDFSLGGYPLLWILDENRRPALTSRIVYRKKVPHSN
ncbi:MAG: hypothetical protein VXV96_08885 [Bdellovibrionota bacterium]|nr:hypothetical protein [Bdellovibrionota bacterium]